MHPRVGILLTGLTLGLWLFIAGPLGPPARPTTAAAVRPPPAPTTGSDWPMYGHDLSRTNYNPGETTISRNNVSQLILRWDAPLSYEGGPPSIANGRVYISEGVLRVFDARTGAPLWTGNICQTGSCVGGIVAAPAISGTTVVSAGDDAAYYGLAGDGTPLWREAIEPDGQGAPFASPLLAYGRAYLGIDVVDSPTYRGELRAVDLQTGVLLANRYFVDPGQGSAGIWHSPALSPDGNTLAVTTGDDDYCDPCPYARAIVTLDPLSLVIRQHDQEGSFHADADWGSTPLFFHDSQGRALVGALHKNGYFYAYGVNTVDAGPVWSRATGLNIGMMPAYDPTYGPGGTLFIYSGMHEQYAMLYALDPATGADRWPPVSLDPLENAYGNMAIANGLIFLGENRQVQILDETNGQVLRTLTPAGITGGYGIAVANGMIYWDDNYLNAWGLPDCPTPFLDVSGDDPFYAYIRCLYCRGIVGGYTSSPPCAAGGVPCFLSGANVTRGQTAKFVSNAANYQDVIPSTQQTFTDVPPSNPFWLYVERAALHGVISGYTTSPPCTTGVPCFLPGNAVTRGQTAKFVSQAANYQDVIPARRTTFTDVLPGSTFWLYVERDANHGVISGYSTNPPCPMWVPCFLPSNPVTRGQTSKFIADAFFPNCQTPAR